MPRLERPEIHAKALAECTPLGTIRTGDELGYTTRHKWVWDDCPCCSARRWVPLHKRGRWCRRCAAKRADRVLKIRASLRRGPTRTSYLCALGHAAEDAGLTLEELQEMAREGQIHNV